MSSSVPSERVQRQMDRLLVDADVATSKGDWAMARIHVHSVWLWMRRTLMLGPTLMVRTGQP
jgi:hypothetical protein